MSTSNATRSEWSALRSAALLVALVVAMARLPLLGAQLAGKELAPYEEPLARLGLVEHAPFSPILFAIGTLIFAAALIALIAPLLRANVPPSPPPRVFPWWGWAGAALGVLSWICAWSSAPIFAALRPHTFTPLWIGYIAVVNGLTWRRTGRCFLLQRRALPIAALSAVFWWFFEYLNRFVESWTYHGVPISGPLDVLLHAVLPFATVLPAVISTQELLAASPRIDRAFANRTPRLSIPHPRAAGLAAVLLSFAGLLALSWLPNILFPLLWLSPLFILTGAQAALGVRHIFSDLPRGDFRLLAASALAGLIAGFFWEMWNFGGVARWSYSIPYVDAVRIFEMPILGYAGYITFGWECAAVASLVKS